jgi:hypothetical protein
MTLKEAIKASIENHYCPFHQGYGPWMRVSLRGILIHADPRVPWDGDGSNHFPVDIGMINNDDYDLYDPAKYD